ncbi:MAG: glycosyltransferase family 39 protein [Bacteroidales bacterium]|nr:glycosyltransferase family 39 protein [Bacteroidales bacterium]
MAFSLHTISNKKIIKYSFIIFIVAMVFRVVIINFVNTDKIAPDGTGYYHLAYNLSKGNGYLMHGEPYFFREPGYPLFLSLAFVITDWVGYETGTLEFDDDFRIVNKVPEIIAAKYLQAIIDSLACVILFLILTRFIKIRYAFLIGILFAIFFHYAYNITSILRETLQSFVSLSMCLALVQYFKSNSDKYLIFTGILWGFLNLIFYPNLIFAVTIPIFIWIYKKSFFKAIRPSIIIGIVMFITVSPWLYRSYSYFPDIRIFKSFGTSITPEYLNYYSALQTAAYYNYITIDDANAIFRNELVDGISETDRFKIYWDGTIAAKADSLLKMVNEPIVSYRKIINLISYSKNILPPTFSKYFIEKSMFVYGILISVVIGYGLFALFGFFFYFKKLLFLNIILITYISAFYVLASEGRRMLPIHPFLFTYFVLGINYIFLRFYCKLSETEVYKQVMKSQV